MDVRARGWAPKGLVRHWGWEMGGFPETKISMVRVVAGLVFRLPWEHIRPQHRRVVVDCGANRFAGSGVAPRAEATAPASEEET